MLASPNLGDAECLVVVGYVHSLLPSSSGGCCVPRSIAVPSKARGTLCTACCGKCRRVRVKGRGERGGAEVVLRQFFTYVHLHVAARFSDM